MPKETGEMEKTAALLSSEEYKLRIRAIEGIVPNLANKEKLKHLIAEDADIESLQKSLEAWKLIFEQLPPDANLQNIMTFAVPDYGKFDFSLLSNPERVRSLFTIVEKAKSHMQNVERICAKYKVVPKFAFINDLIKSYEELLRVLKNPSAATGDPALILKRNEKTLVSIPLDVALTKTEYLRGIEPTPIVHKPKHLDEASFKEEIFKAQETVTDSVSELRTAKKDLTESGNLLKKAKQIRDDLGKEIELAENRKKEVKRNLDKLTLEWKTGYHHLCTIYSLQKKELDLSSLASVDVSLEIISENYLTAKKILETDLEKQLKSYPQFAEKYKGQRPIDIVKGVTKEFEKRIDEMNRLENNYRKVNEWILSNLDQIKSLENRDKTAEIVKEGLTIVLELLQVIHEKADVKKVIEELADKIEVNVGDVYEKIFPEDKTFSFEHLGKGQFLSSISKEPITHPSGSQRVAISLGIMLSLGETFGMPILLDEAFDRVDANRLRFLAEYITGIAGSSNTPQICLAGFTTYNIEKNAEVLAFVKRWKAYQVKRTSLTEKAIELFKGFQDL
jgi:hypothetical protein